VNAWLLAVAIMMVGLVPCAWICLRGHPGDRLIALLMGGTVNTLLLLLMSVGFKRGAFADLAIALAVLSFGGGLLFARFLERWL
jgi:multisubunit Na+/H+ antiporter MnhF subunit